MNRKNKSFDFGELFESIADYIKNNPLIVGLSVAAGVLVVVAIAALVMVFSSGGGDDVISNATSSSDSYDSQSGNIDSEVYSDVILPKSELLDPDYLEETLFIGDSNTYRLINFGYTTLQNNVSFVSMGINGAVNSEEVYFRDRDDPVSIAQAVEILQPRRVIITFGTNDASITSTADFIEGYSDFIDDIRFYYPSVDIIINTIPPVARDRDYNNISMSDIDKLNAQLVELAREMDCMFLNSAEALKDSTGYGDSDFFVSDGIHISDDGAEEFINYVLEHSYVTDDDRPTLKAVPVRYEPKPQVIPSAPSDSSSTSESGIEVKFVVDSETHGRIEGEATQNIEIGESATTVVAVAEDGYAFSHWTVTNGRIDDINDPSLTFTVPTNADGGIIITAHFTDDDSSSSSEELSENVDIILSVDNESRGTLSLSSGTHTVKRGESITITATPKDGYQFNAWTDTSGKFQHSKNATITYTVDDTTPDSVVIRALFETESEDPDPVTISVSSANTTAGTAAASVSSIVPGNSVTFTATANAGYEFSHWVIGGANVGGTATYNYTIPNNATGTVTAVAHFTAEVVVTPVTITINAENPAMGTTTASTSATPGTTINITATPSAGYEFVEWVIDINDGNFSTNTSATLAYTVPVGQTATITFTAKFRAVSTDSSSSSESAPTP